MFEQSVWIVANRSSHPRGVRVTDTGARGGGFALIIGKDGRFHAIRESKLFASRAELIAANPGLDVEPGDE